MTLIFDIGESFVPGGRVSLNPLGRARQGENFCHPGRALAPAPCGCYTAGMTPAPERSAGLPRVLGPWMGCAIVVGTIIGSGVFKKPQAVADLVPFTGVAALVWVAAGLLVLLGALAYAEVAVLF